MLRTSGLPASDAMVTAPDEAPPEEAPPDAGSRTGREKLTGLVLPGLANPADWIVVVPWRCSVAWTATTSAKTTITVIANASGATHRSRCRAAAAPAAAPRLAGVAEPAASSPVTALSGAAVLSLALLSSSIRRTLPGDCALHASGPSGTLGSTTQAARVLVPRGVLVFN